MIWTMMAGLMTATQMAVAASAPAPVAMVAMVRAVPAVPAVPAVSAAPMVAYATVAARPATIDRRPAPATALSAGRMEPDGFTTSDTDPADSLFRVANERLAKGDYKGAAELFRSVRQRYPKSARLGEAMYYEAFSLYRTGDLGRARSTLDDLKARYPQQAARGDANTLRTRICGELARQGDGDCAEEVTRMSASAAATVDSARASVRTSSGGSYGSRGGASRTARTADCPGNDDEDDDERVAALNALLQMDADRAVPILTKVMAKREKCTERLRRKAVFLISQKHTPETADLLLAAAKDDPDAEVREQAVFWMSQLREPRVADMLSSLLNNPKSEPALREKALFALSQNRSAKSTEALRSFAENESAPGDLREKAIFWIGQQPGNDKGEYLRSLYRRLNNVELKEKVLFAMSQQRSGGNDAFLMGIVGDPKEPVELRKKAIFWVSQMGGDLTQINGLYGKIDDREIKDQLIFAYSQRREPAAVDRLMEIARTEKDKELKKKAIFWLGQSRDPRAAGFLAELIDK
jgi:HEAT repeat protein